MRVRELIERLEELDPEVDVRIQVVPSGDLARSIHTMWAEVEKVEIRYGVPHAAVVIEGVEPE